MKLGALRKAITEVTLGLHAILARGMIHRDIKPGNLLKDVHETAKIGDFGLVTDDLILGYASATGYTDHLAPEVFAGVGTSIGSDIWALGMTTYRLLHGEIWYSRHPPPRTVVRSGGFVDTLTWLPHIPKPWKRLVRSMLQDNKAKRPQSTAAVLNALSKMPIEPDWECKVANDEVEWTRSKGDRRHTVVWQIGAPGSCVWSASNSPNAAGRTMKLGASQSAATIKASTADLADFFARCR